MNPMDPHAESPVARAGVPLERARAVVVMLHGRGAVPEDILSLAPEIDPGQVAYLAPAAAANTWYPQPFLAPLEANEPWLTSALRRLGTLLEAIETQGPGLEKTVLLGFSQGACLALEYACRNARRYGGLVGLSGGLIGPSLDPDRYQGDFEGTPALLGCSDVDPHIPLTRVRETAQTLERLGAQVDLRIYPGMGHLVNRDELAAVAAMLRGVATEG